MALSRFPRGMKPVVGSIGLAAAFLLAACGAQQATSPGGTSSATGGPPSVTVPANATLFQDPVGDVEGGPGPDITSLAVYQQSGKTTFVLTLAAPPLVSSEPAAEKDGVTFFITTVDKSGGKKEAFAGAGSMGSDIRFRHCGVLACNEPSDSSKFVHVPSVVSGNTVSVTLPDSFLLDPAQMNLKVAATRFLGETGNGGGDAIPNTGEASYVVSS